MNRRSFTKMLGAALTLPALPAPALAVAKPAAVAVPSQARFWAIYMHSLHGECTPRALQTMLNIPADQAKSYLHQLVLDGVVKPNPMAQLLQQNQSTGSQAWQDLKAKVKDRLQQSVQADQDDMPPADAFDGPSDDVDGDAPAATQDPEDKA